MRMNSMAWSIALLSGSALVGSAFAAQFAYPPAGRTAEQQQQDQYECHQWAVAQTGYDPSRVAPTAAATAGQPASASQPAGGVVEGAARGVAVAEVADEDSADGARAGATVGLLRQRRAQASAAQENARAQQETQQQQQRLAARRGAYDSARSTCLKGRGYTLSDS